MILQGKTKQRDTIKQLIREHTDGMANNKIVLSQRENYGTKLGKLHASQNQIIKQEKTDQTKLDDTQCQLR